MSSPTSEPQYNGGCFCNNIRYQVLGKPIWVGHCHCHICRRTSGAAFASWADFELSNFSLNQEATAFNSSEYGERSFCPICGTQLLYKDSHVPRYSATHIH